MLKRRYVAVMVSDSIPLRQLNIAPPLLGSVKPSVDGVVDVSRRIDSRISEVFSQATRDYERRDPKNWSDGGLQEAEDLKPQQHFFDVGLPPDKETPP